MINYGVIVNETFGDALYTTPTIAYLSKCHNQKIDVETMFPELFKNNPYVGKIYDSTKSEKLPDDVIIYNLQPNLGGDMFKQRKINSVDYFSTNLGFTLPNNEKTLIYIPDKLDIELPDDKYVVINPSVTTPDRTWSKNNWEKLIDLIIDTEVKVVIVGKDIVYEHDFNRSTFHFNDDRVINLVNKLNISQLWHIVQNSLCVFTMNAGLYPFAGTTDTKIIALGGSYHPYYRAPYRHGTQDYKHYFVGGTCNVFCHTNLKYNSLGDVKVTGGYPPIGCYEKKKTYECHPTPEDFFKTYK